MKTNSHFLFIIHVLAALAFNLAAELPAGADSFKLTTSMDFPRMDHDAVRLQSGLVLVAGGIGTNGYLSSSETYNPASGTWFAAGAMSNPRAGLRLTLLSNGQVLASGGVNSNGYVARTEIFDPGTLTWSLGGSLVTARAAHTATLLTNGLILIAGGENSGGSLASAELYAPYANTSTPTNSMNSAHFGPTATLLPDGTVLIAGGTDTSGNPTGAELFHPTTGTWTLTGPMTTPRDSHTAVLLTNGMVLVAGGYDTNGMIVAKAELFNPANGTWSATDPMTTPRRAHTATLLKSGLVLVAGGDAIGNSAELYNPNPGFVPWVATTNLMNTPRDQHTATLLLNGNVLIAGGNIGSGPTNSAELYTLDIGSLEVTLNPPTAVSAGAQWQADSGAFQNSGTVVSNLPAGNHTVAFNTIAGWFTPAAQTVTVNSGATTNVFATYLPNLGALQVTINPICAVENGAAWQVDGGSWQTSGAVVTNLAGGNHTVSFTNVVGWLAPSSQTVMVTANTTNTATGDYIEGSTPGVITWINIGGPDQHWSTATNWDLNRAPTTNDIVLIPNTGGNTCLMDVDATIAGLMIGDCDGGGSDGLGINGHTLTVAGLLTIKSNAVFRVDSGILMGTSNTVISGVLGWTSGGLAGTLTLGSSGILNISGGPGGQYFSNCLFTNNGTVNWSGDALSAGGSVVIDNYGVWNAQDDRYFYGPNVVFNNYGTFRKSGGIGGYPGTYFYNGAVFNQLAGVLDIQSGTNGLELTLVSGGSFSGGYVTTNLNGITYLGGGNFNINGTLTCANVIFGGSYLVGTNVINGGLTWQNGQWNNTVVTLGSNSVLTINNPAYGKGISGSMLTNYGTVNWSASAVNADGGTVIYNYGVWNAQDDHYFNGGAGAVFNNYGTFRKSGGVGGYPGTYFNSGAVFNQLAGVLDIQSDTNGLWLTLTSGGSFTGGYVTTNLNGITYLGGGNFNINGTLTCTNVIFGGSYLVGANVINGGLTWQNGQWNNTVVTVSSNSVLTLDNPAYGKGINGSILTNYGTVNWSAAAVNGDGGTVIDNYGVWNAQDDHYFNGGNYGAVFNNYGTFRKSGGVGGYPGTFFNSGAVFNQLAGVLDVQSGTNGLQLSLVSGGSFTGGYVTTNLNGITYLGGGNFNINGTLTCTNVLFGGSYLVGTNVINGGLAWINGWWNGLVIVNTNSLVSIYATTYGKTFNGLVMNYGTVNWSADQLNANGGAVIDNYGVWNAQDNHYFYGSGLVLNNYGIFLKSGGASGYPGTYFTGGTIFNQVGGTLSVQTGDVTLGGTYSLTNGTLNFGINSATDNGVLLLGSLALGGTLSANVSGSFAPAVGDQFGVVGSSGLSGTFTSVHLPAGIVVSNINNTVLLTVTGPVPVQLLNPQPVGTNFLFQFPTVSGQSYTVQRNDVLSSTNWVYYTNLTGSGTLFQFQTPITATPAQRFFRVRQP